MLLHEPSLVSLIKERSGSLEVTGLWKCIEDSSIESSNPFVWVGGTVYVIDQNLGSGS